MTEPKCLVCGHSWSAESMATMQSLNDFHNCTDCMIHVENNPTCPTCGEQKGPLDYCQYLKEDICASCRQAEEEWQHSENGPIGAQNNSGDEFDGDRYSRNFARAIGEIDL